MSWCLGTGDGQLLEVASQVADGGPAIHSVDVGRGAGPDA